MAAELLALGLGFTKIDVDADPALRARYGRRVPVLADAEDREICHARLDAPALRARLGLE